MLSPLRTIKIRSCPWVCKRPVLARLAEEPERRSIRSRSIAPAQPGPEIARLVLPVDAFVTGGDLRILKHVPLQPDIGRDPRSDQERPPQRAAIYQNLEAHL